MLCRCGGVAASRQRTTCGDAAGGDCGPRRWAGKRPATIWCHWHFRAASAAAGQAVPCTATDWRIANGPNSYANDGFSIERNCEPADGLPALELEDTGLIDDRKSINAGSADPEAASLERVTLAPRSSGDASDAGLAEERVTKPSAKREGADRRRKRCQPQRATQHTNGRRLTQLRRQPMPHDYFDLNRDRSNQQTARLPMSGK